MRVTVFESLGEMEYALGGCWRFGITTSISTQSATWSSQAEKALFNA
jgi:hypothetical protein